ncbi:hypothetical protein OESDEN_22067, partial [Oesophagostomum dentatum]
MRYERRPRRRPPTANLIKERAARPALAIFAYYDLTGEVIMKAVFQSPAPPPPPAPLSSKGSFHRSASTSSTLTDVISEELFPKFASADEDWNDFGYLLDAEKDSGTQVEASRGNASSKTAEINRPRPVAINPAEISLGGDVVCDWSKESKPQTEVKEVQFFCFLLVGFLFKCCITE